MMNWKPKAVFPDSTVCSPLDDFSRTSEISWRFYVGRKRGMCECITWTDALTIPAAVHLSTIRKTEKSVLLREKIAKIHVPDLGYLLGS
jgi:hypothetical protein